uniref:Secreted protein n=1 Tax=Romanomermis culicivorax TaxID=13658 RepID=A0A915HRC6_ROMCU
MLMASVTAISSTFNALAGTLHTCTILPNLVFYSGLIFAPYHIQVEILRIRTVSGFCCMPKSSLSAHQKNNAQLRARTFDLLHNRQMRHQLIQLSNVDGSDIAIAVVV